MICTSWDGVDNTSEKNCCHISLIWMR